MAAALMAGSLLSACSDDTGINGTDIMPGGDSISISTARIDVPTRTIESGTLLANSPASYLGALIDPEVGAQTRMDFLTQFHVPDNFVLPAQDRMIKDAASGAVVADSCDLRIYLDSYQGDSLAMMKLRLSELSASHTLEESETYYTDLNPKDYVSTDADALTKSVTYSVKDLSRPDKETTGTTYYRQIVVKLPVAYGTKILQHYYAAPQDFANAYRFIHNVCPGFYIESAGGTGSIVKSTMMGLNLYFRYHTTTTTGKDTIVDGMQRFGATQEVMQTTRTGSVYAPEAKQALLADASSSYVKSPASLLTEMTLPVNDTFSGAHAKDSLMQASMIIRTYDQSRNDALKAPEYLLLVKKGELKNFFEKNQLPDSRASYLSSQLTTSAPYYKFANVARLMKDLRYERDAAAGVTADDTEAQREAKRKAWEGQHPDWNVVYLVPVAPTYTTTTNAYGMSSKVLQTVRHDFSVSSVRLEGGTSGTNGLRMDLIYGTYHR